MRIAVVGLGGVGGYFGARLVEAGHEVAFIARGVHLEAIQRQGLRVYSPQGDFVARPEIATNDPAAIGTVDLVIVATKAWQVESTAPSLKPLLGENTLILPLLNGVEAPTQLAHALGEGSVLGGFCRVFSWIEAAGVVRHGGIQPYICFGEMAGGTSPRVQALYEALQGAKFILELSENIQGAMWQKLSLIAPWSGVGAVTRQPIGVIRSTPPTRALLIEAIHETIAVAQGRGVRMLEDAAARVIKQIDDAPAESTASMQRDILEGKPSELEAQNGAVVRLGAEVGVPTPVHRFLYASLLPMENLARQG